MRIDYEKLKMLPVETESGTSLGRVIGLELDTEKHLVLKYLVTKSKFFADRLLIAPAQIVRITAQRMIVEDSVCREKRSLINTERFSAVEPVATNAEFKN